MYKHVCQLDSDKSTRPRMLQSVSPTKMSFNPMTKGEIVIEDSQSPEFMTLEKMQNLGKLAGHEKPGI